MDQIATSKQLDEEKSTIEAIIKKNEGYKITEDLHLTGTPS